MFKTYEVKTGSMNPTFGIKFNEKLILIAGRHPEKCTKVMVDYMNKIHKLLPKASPSAIRAFVHTHFNFEEYYK